MTKASSAHEHTLPEIQGRWLTLARIVWLVLMALALIIFALAVPAWGDLIQTLSSGNAGGNIAPEETVPAAPVLTIVAATLALLVTLGSYVVSVLLFRQTTHSRIAYFTSLFLILYSTIALGPIEGAQETLRGIFEIPRGLNFSLLIVCAAWLFWVFPNGRFTPRWLRYLVVPTALLHVFWTVTDTYPTGLPEDPTLFERINSNLSALIWFSVLFAQIYRYWRVSNALERQQARWVMVGLLSWIVMVVIAGLGAETGSLPPAVTGMFWYVGLSMLPLALSIAILRYRLWAVDVIIRRTLTYALITLLLAGTYYGGVVLMQNIFVRITGQESPLAVVASTLAIAALFNPLRRRVQGFIDRRFDRRKYDAQQTLERFGDIARDEVDLGQLEQALIAVVGNTVQPEYVSLWLSDSTDGRQGS